MFTNPLELTRQSSAAFTGTVVDVAPGRSIVSEGQWYRTRDNWVVVQVRVDQTISDSYDAADDGSVYVSMRRGVNAIDQAGEVIPDDPNPSVVDVKKALTGIRVLVMANPDDVNVLLDGPNTSLERGPTEIPAGATLLDGVHPQRMVFDEGNERLEDWPEYTFDGLVAAASKG
ncbi:MAG: hypothetical protein EOP83_22355 [Verrucomicrobiaceae bacterium]|nr:MAG: hypothetical protein EOP83_22355 [Verrucomicrobiaceae bacterium]